MNPVVMLLGGTLVVGGILWRLREIQKRAATADAPVKAPAQVAPAAGRPTAVRKAVPLRHKTGPTAAMAEAPLTALASDEAQRVRRSDRIQMKLTVEVSGADAEGRLFTEQTQTRVINRNGASLVLTHSLAADGRLRVTNLQSGRSCAFRTCGPRFDLGGGRCEWAVECLEPAPDFWGIVFPDDSGVAADETAVGSLVECTSCHCREMVRLSLQDYRTIAREGFAPRRCTWCGRVTLWKFAAVQPETAPVPTAVPTPAGETPADPLPVDRRHQERHIIRLPVSIRHADGREELTIAEDVSTSGLCCAADMDLTVGERVFLRLATGEGFGDAELRATVLWRRPGNTMRRSYYGMKLERK